MQNRGSSIEEESMRIIDEEAGAHPYNETEWPIVQRMIHATADFDFAGVNAVVFGNDAIRSGTGALGLGCNIITDVNGVAGLLNKQNTKDYKNDIICKIGDEKTARLASSTKTRAQASMRRSRSEMEGGIVAIGNAPTALLEVISMISEGARPALVIGMPVGFVSAAESKAELESTNIPFITNKGRKGGSATAASAVNALFKILRSSAR